MSSFPPDTTAEVTPESGPQDLPAEANPSDVQEQQEAVVPEPPPMEGDLPSEATEADVTEQRREVTLDEEDAPIG